MSFGRDKPTKKLIDTDRWEDDIPKIGGTSYLKDFEDLTAPIRTKKIIPPVVSSGTSISSHNIASPGQNIGAGAVAQGMSPGGFSGGGYQIRTDDPYEERFTALEDKIVALEEARDIRDERILELEEEIREVNMRVEILEKENIANPKTGQAYWDSMKIENTFKFRV